VKKERQQEEDQETKIYVYYQASNRIVAGPISIVCVKILDLESLVKRKSELKEAFRKQLERDITKVRYTNYEKCIDSIEELVDEKIIEVKDRVVLPSLLGGRDPESYLNSVKENLIAQVSLSFTKSKPLQTVVRCTKAINPTPFYRNSFEYHSVGSLLTKTISEYRRLYLIEKVYRCSYPEYSLDVCKGILTNDHALAILKYGLKPIHIPTRLRNLTNIWFNQLKNLNNGFLDLPYDFENIPSWWEDYFLKSDFAQVAITQNKSEVITGKYPEEFLTWLQTTKETCTLHTEKKESV
jgi:hypothetical protein